MVVRNYPQTPVLVCCWYIIIALKNEILYLLKISKVMYVPIDKRVNVTTGMNMHMAPDQAWLLLAYGMGDLKQYKKNQMEKVRS